MKKNMIVVFAVLLMTVLSAAPAMATQYNCVGPITLLAIDQGQVVVSVGGVNAGAVCQLNGTAPNGYTADTCKGIYAMLLAAKLSGQQVLIAFNDNLTCSTQPAWSWINPIFGPELF